MTWVLSATIGISSKGLLLLLGAVMRDAGSLDPHRSRCNINLAQTRDFYPLMVKKNAAPFPLSASAHTLPP